MQTVLITGASSGFGRVTAEKLARLGYKVFGTSRRTGQNVASKFALVGYSEALRYELAPFGIHVSLIEPGFFKTNIEQVAIPAEKTIEDYRAVRSALETAIKQGFEKARDAGEVATLIAEVIKTPKPALHYPIGNEANALQLKRFLPESLFESGFKRGFGLDKVKPTAMTNLTKEIA